MVWNVRDLSRPPRTFPAPGRKAEGVRGLFYEGLPYRGRPTRVFAWYGAPRRRGRGKLPAVVLAHGGGGTAFPQWVRMWNERGYAAIAMDMEGQAPTAGDPGARERHRWAGPANQCFGDIREPVGDQWMNHAVADVVLANSLLRSFPEVDARRIGMTGISWGAVVIEVAAGIDKRFGFAAPVYGCGFLEDADNYFADIWSKMTREDGEKCSRLWDPARYLGRTTLPMLWVTGSNEDHFPLHILRRSYRLPRGPRVLCVRVRMWHGHEPGWEPGEIFAFADAVVNDGVPLPEVTGRGRNARRAWATYTSATPVVRAELNFTKGRGKWPVRRWETRPADLDAKAGRASAVVPVCATAWYFNLVDDRGLLVSTEHAAAGRRAGRA